jgi:glycosyltransferase involved in cell wall biosynthesis
MSGPSVLNVSLDSQIAWGSDPSRPLLGDPAERQRRYAEHLTALHVVVKTGKDVRADVVPLAGNAWAYPTRSRSRYAFVADAYRIGARLLRTQRVDVISAQDPFATGLVSWLLARRFGLPLNVQVHFDVLDNPHWIGEKREHRALNTLGKWLVRQADTVRVGTTYEAERFARWGIPRERIFVAPVPVDLARFVETGSKAIGETERHPTILNASRLVPQKDLGTLLKAMQRVAGEVPGSRLLIAGDGPLRPTLDEQARQLGIADRVKFLGRVDIQEMPALMAGADVLAVTSLYEGTSLVTVQAAAAGKPVVSTDVAGVRDTVVHGETGLVVPVGDAGALAEALIQVLRHAERAGAMGASGRAHVLERFDHARAVDKVIAMWEATAAGRTTTQVGGRWLYLANVRVPSEKAHVYQIFQMLDAFKSAGVDVTLAFPRRANIEAVRDADPATLYGMRHAPALRALPAVDPVRLVTIDVPALNRAPFPQAAFGVQSASYALAALAEVRRQGPDVVYGRDWPVLALALAGGRPVVWEAHDLPQHGPARLALTRVLPRFAGVVAITEGLRRELLEAGVAADRVLVAPDAVDLRRFAQPLSREAARELLGLDASLRHVVYTGHLYRWKGAHTLAEASAQLPQDVLVHVVGGTPADLVSFRHFVEERRLARVQIAGHVPPADVPMWLAAADVLALPNSGAQAISSRYTSPLKLFEYMAAGKAIVASDLPSLREVLTHEETALLVPPDDVIGLASGIRRVLDDAALGERLGQRARDAVQGRTWDARAAAIVDFVRRITAQ